jgi:hypothetical protein
VRIFWVQTDIAYGNITFPNRFYFDILNSDNNNEWPCIWIHKDSMTDQEKIQNPTRSSAEWYLKKVNIEKDIKVHRRAAFNKCTDIEDIKKTLELPHFDYDKFEFISWISKEDFDKKLGKSHKKETIIIGGIGYDKDELEEKLKNINPVK